MKILNFLNVSNISNLEADSGFVFQNLLMTEILRQKPDWHFYFISPKVPVNLEERITHIELDYGHNKYEARFNFPWNELNNKTQNILDNIDVILINQSEHATNFRALVTSRIPDRRIPIVGYFHYLPIEPPHIHFDFSSDDYDIATNVETRVQPISLRFDQTLNLQGLARTIFMRQIEALLDLDYAVTCSEFAIDLLVGNAQKIVPFTAPKISAIPPPISFIEAQQSYDQQRNERKEIVFNHRLYNHYGPKEFFDFMDWFYANVRKDFQVIITDPTNGRSTERNLLDPTVNSTRSQILAKPYVRYAHSPSRKEYYKTIANSTISIGPFKPSALWSMSVVDSMACGIPVVCPNYACFPEILGASSDLLFSKPKELAHLINCLFDDTEFYRESSQYCLLRAQNFSVGNTARKFIDIFEQVKNGN